ncbi:tetratricopeptide repeat protein [Winogradskyella aurantiaca]|uniref:tetratricopeptide repeat protein n=1 Tax=Winogradskyella aurantiaca TaxID=2219558 RepID=UPI000E1DC062|nr:tetratricopeptide repeat protein [Winogradskyella aurantiaca]
MKTIKHALIFLLFIAVQNTYPQLDSLRQIYTDARLPDSIRFQALHYEFDEYRFKSPQSTLKAVYYHQKLAKEKNNKEELYYGFLREAYFSPELIDLEKSISLHNEALKIAKELKMRDKEAHTKANRAVIYLNLGKHLEGVRNYYDALAIFKELEMNSQATWLLQNIGVVNLRIGNYDIALDYFQQYEDAYNKYNLTTQELYSWNHLYIGETYLEKKFYEDALIYLTKALGDFELSESKFGLQKCYKHLARVHMALNQLLKANDYAKKSLAICKEFEWEMDILDAKIMLTEITLKTDKTSACKEGQNILSQLPEDTNNHIKQRLYTLLYNCYKSRDNPQLTAEVLELSIAYKDSVNLEIDRMAIIQELVKQDYETRLSENKLKSEVEKAAIQSSQRRKIYVLIIAAVLLIFLTQFYFRSKIKKDKAIRDSLLNKIEELKNRAETELIVNAKKFQLDIEKIEERIDKKLNQTDRKVLNILLEDPVIANKDIANKVFLSIDGVGSSLRRMYEYFNIKESKYKKISLLLEVVKLSNS